MGAKTIPKETMRGKVIDSGRIVAYESPIAVGWCVPCTMVKLRCESGIQSSENGVQIHAREGRLRITVDMYEMTESRAREFLEMVARDVEARIPG